ncbi:odorant receptor 13a-like [Lasioglossum baleicum]|uniref:odorant receptor 13a-like n=1 Tax=Lasioglossum baleicum TaxID=434251 RepID=UPI003FCE3959
MGLKHGKGFSIVLSAILMKCVGIWFADNPFEQRLRNGTLIYTVIAIVFGVWVQAEDLFHTWDDFGARTYIACNIMCLNIALLKIFIISLHKKKFLGLVEYMDRNFWHSNYAPYEQMIFLSWKRVCTYFICIFTFFTEASIMGYAIRPIVANVGRNDSDRILPFNMWINLPWTLTPYFEITFVLQVLSLYHVGVCYICCDNFLCIMNLHVAGQFRILQNRLKNIHRSQSADYKHEKWNDRALQSQEKQYYTFKSYVQQHQALIAYCAELEHIFSPIVLAQVLTFSLLICFVGYQAILADVPITRRIIFVNLLTSSMCQLLMFTYSCDCLIRESAAIATAAYAVPWMKFSMDKFGKQLRRDLQFVVMRTTRPCCLTANKFFAVSLETYTSVLSTAMSYFTLLKQNSSHEMGL